MNVSSFALKSNFVSLKTQADKTDVNLAKLSNVAETNVVKKTVYDKLVAKVDNIDTTLLYYFVDTTLIVIFANGPLIREIKFPRNIFLSSICEIKFPRKKSFSLQFREIFPRKVIQACLRRLKVIVCMAN